MLRVVDVVDFWKVKGQTKMANDGIKSVTPTPDQWHAWRNCQLAARSFLQAAEGPVGKQLVAPFQKAFNAATSCLAVIITAKGGDPSKSFAALPGGLPLTVDGLYGQTTCYALGLVVMFSFPADVAKTAAGQLMQAPFVRNKVTPWTKAWSPQVKTMVAGTYTEVVTNAQNPVFTPKDTAGTIVDATNSQQTTTTKIEDGKSNVIEVPTTSSTSLPVGTDSNPLVLPAEDVSGEAPKKYTWLWVTLGLGAAGSALYWFFGKKKR